MSGHHWVMDDTRTSLKPLRLVNVCTKYGCLKFIPVPGPSELQLVAQSTRRGSFDPCDYRPKGFTWNPFRTLTSEPPCPARWP